MAINTLAPGVYSTIKDSTAVVDSIPGTTALIAMICEKGPDNQLIKVNRSDLYRMFGAPDINYTHNTSYGLGHHIAAEYLDESASCYVIRVLPSDSTNSATYSVLPLYISGGLISEDQTGDVDTTQSDLTIFWPDLSGIIANVLPYTKDLETLKNVVTGYEVPYVDSTSDNASGAYQRAIACFYGVGRGAYYDKIKINLTKKHNLYTNDDSGSSYYYVNQILSDSSIKFDEINQYVLDVYVVQPGSKTLSGFDVAHNNKEVYQDYQLVESFTVSFFPDAVDAGGTSIYIEEVINRNSDYINCVVNEDFMSAIKMRMTNNDPYDTTSAPSISTLDFSETFADLNTGDVSGINSLFFTTGGIRMIGGWDGNLFSLKGGRHIDTSSATQTLVKAYEGTLPSALSPDTLVDEVLDTDNVWFDLILDAGYPADVKQAIVTLAQTRRDCLAIVDNGDHFKPRFALQDRVEKHLFVTPYAALYEPYSKIYDSFSGKDLWVPPSYHMCRLFAANDNQNYLWSAVAGFKRGIINKIKELRYNCKLNDREDFTRAQINPIVKFPEGIMCFGQRTTLTYSSARMDVSVVRLINYIERSLKVFCRQFIFDFNDEETRSKIANEISAFLKEVKNNKGLYGYRCSVNSSDYDISHRRVVVDIVLQPMRCIEQIHLNFEIKN